MRGCLWYVQRKHRKDLEVTNSSPKHDSDKDHETKDEVWFESRLAFESDSDDDFKSVNGDSLPSSFGYSYTSQGTPRPTFATLKERMEELVQENGAAHDVFSPPRSGRMSSEEKKTLGQLFLSKLEENQRPEIENKQSVMLRQGSKKGSPHDGVSQRSCFPGLLPSVGSSSEKKSPSRPTVQRTKATQLRLPYRLCAS